jgi:hypothetical protein
MPSSYPKRRRNAPLRREDDTGSDQNHGVSIAERAAGASAFDLP